MILSSVYGALLYLLWSLEMNLLILSLFGVIFFCSALILFRVDTDKHIEEGEKLCVKLKFFQGVRSKLDAFAKDFPDTKLGVHLSSIKYTGLKRAYFASVLDYNSDAKLWDNSALEKVTNAAKALVEFGFSNLDEDLNIQPDDNKELSQSLKALENYRDEYHKYEKTPHLRNLPQFNDCIANIGIRFEPGTHFAMTTPSIV